MRSSLTKIAGDLPTRLVPACTAELWPALITPPESAVGIWHNSERAGLHSRPRLDVIDSLPQLILPPQVRGGLPPSHLEENIALETLADIAGFSMFHFARAFKQSEGVTPHGYLLERRVERAQKLLTGTNLSLSEIAIASGFSDQSHLARHFRQRFGQRRAK